MRIHRFLWHVLIMCLIIAPFSSHSEETGEQIGLKDVIEKTLANNPKISSFYHLYESSKELYSTAGAQPNPELQLSYINGTGPEDANSISQTLEIFGRAGFRKSVALCAMKAQQAQYMIQCQQIVEDVCLAYVEVLRARQIHQVEENNLRLAENLLKAAQKRFDVGDIPQMQVLQFRIEHSRAKSDLDASLVEEKKALAALCKLMGYSPSAHLYLWDFPFNPESTLPPLTDLKSTALVKRPEILQAIYERDEETARRSLIASETHPDIIFSAYRSQLNPIGNDGVRASVAVPLWDWGNVRGQVRASRQKEQAAEKNIEEIRNQVLLETETSYMQLENLQLRLRDLNTDVLKDQEKLILMVQRGYEAGISSYLEVMEARRSLRDIQKQYYEILAESRRTLIRLERASGTELYKKEGDTLEKY